MTPHEFHQYAAGYFAARYELIQELPFVQERPQRLADHLTPADRRCRFCSRGEPEVTFKEVAHAAPEFLGNRALISMNECDPCNAFFGRGGGHEDHLAKWSALARALSQVPRKGSGRPKFKCDDETLRVETIDGGLHLHVPSPASPDGMPTSGFPRDFVLEGDTRTQPYVPLRAAMALVKIACSICPVGELEQVRGAIDWIMFRSKRAFKPFPVLYAFTPRVNSDLVSRAILLRRRGEGPEPYLVSLVQFRGFRLQVFVPFCPADRHWLREDGPTNLTLCHAPSLLGPDWPAGPTTFYDGDWSGTEPVRTTMTATFQVDGLVGVSGPGESSARRI